MVSSLLADRLKFMRPHVLTCHPKIPEARAFADLTGVRDDLVEVLAYCDKLQEQINDQHRDLVVWKALSAAAVIAYARCFGDGVRGGLEHELANAAPTPIAEMHQFVIALRNKHVAHSVNAFEENYLRVAINIDEHQHKSVRAVEISTRRFIPISDGEVTKLSGLAEWLLAEVDRRIKLEQEKTFQAVSAKPLADLLKQREEPSYGFAKPGAVSKQRQKL